MADKDAPAAEAAELAVLRDRAAQRRRELGVTVQELAGELRSAGGIRRWTRELARQAARRAARAAWSAIRNAVASTRRSGRPARTAPVAVAAFGCLLAMAFTWRRVRGRSGRQRRPGTRR